MPDSSVADFPSFFGQCVKNFSGVNFFNRDESFNALIRTYIKEFTRG